MTIAGHHNPGTVIEYEGARQTVRGEAGARQELESVK